MGFFSFIYQSEHIRERIKLKEATRIYDHFFKSSHEPLSRPNNQTLLSFLSSIKSYGDGQRSKKGQEKKEGGREARAKEEKIDKERRTYSLFKKTFIFLFYIIISVYEI